MSASPAAVAVLEYGKLLDAALRGTADDAAKLAAAEQQALDALYADRSKAIRDALQYSNNGQNIEPLTLRVVALISYRQLCTNRLVTAVADVACTVAGNGPADILQARQAISGMLFRRWLQLADNSGNVEVSQDLLAFFGGNRLDAPVVPTRDALNRAWRQAEQKTKAKKQKDARIPTAQELAARIATQVVGLVPQVRTMACRLVLHMQRAAMIRAGNDPGSGTGNEALICAGASGVGKTFLATCAGRASGLATCVVSATDMSATGYIGLDVDEVLKGLVTSAGGDVNVARFGIGTIDEVDKVRSSGWEHGSKDVNGASVQQGLLQMIQGAQCVCGGKRSSDEYSLRFNTVGTMFVLCGAFVGLDRMLASRAGCAIGFGSDVSEAKQARYIRDALIDYGMLPELVNRTTGVLVVPEPSRADLKAIAIRSVLPATNRLLASMGAQLEVTKDGVALMADYALETKTYARGIKALISRLVEDLVFNEVKGAVKVVAADVRAAMEADG